MSIFYYYINIDRNTFRKKERKNHNKILGCVEEKREERKKNKHVSPTTILYTCINIDINK